MGTAFCMCDTVRFASIAALWMEIQERCLPALAAAVEATSLQLQMLTACYLHGGAPLLIQVLQ